MKVAGTYSHAGGEEFITERYPHLLSDIHEIIELIDAEKCRLKQPKGKEISRAIRRGITHFFSPVHFNVLFDWYLFNRDWYIKPRIITHDPTREGYREIDAIREGVGVELQFGKYSFLTYDIIAKMVIFRNIGLIKCGIELCLMASMLPHMSSGIGAFEQVIWDLKYRGKADIDVPVLVIGIESNEFHLARSPQSAQTIPEPTYVLDRSIRPGAKTIKKLRQTGLDV